MTNIAVSERIKWVGASEVAALFGLSPYVTRFELWHEKAGSLPHANLDNDERVNAGKFLEPAIGQWAAQKWGWVIRNVEAYLEHPTVRGMGCSLDWEDAEDGAPVEIKNVDGLRFRDGDWQSEGDELIEAPVYFLLQVQHQLACRPDAPHGWLLVCVGGNRLYRMKVERHAKMIARIEREVEAFWISVETGAEPNPDFQADAAAISKLYTGDEDFIDLRGNNRAVALAAEYLDANEHEKQAKGRKSAALAELKLMMAGAREAVIDDGYKVKASHIKAGVIERQAHYRFNVTKPKEKAR